MSEPTGVTNGRRWNDPDSWAALTRHGTPT